MAKSFRKINLIMPRTVGIIPARYGSTRLLGKPLVPLNGKPLIYWVWKQAGKARSLDRLLVATDDLRVKKAVESFGGEAVLTSANFASGSDRVAAVAKRLKCDYVVNIQGDEPMISPAAIDRLVQALQNDKAIDVATLVYRIENESMLNNPNVVKVVFDRNDMALYFSRYPVPYSTFNGRKSLKPQNLTPFYCHIGIYAFRKEFLLKFVTWKPSRLEQSERLEQLRILENGYPIKVVKTRTKSISVDTPEDVRDVEQILKNK